MSLLSWNCQGLGQSLTVGVLKGHVRKYHPCLVFLMEIKQSSCYLDRIRRQCGFDFSYYVDPVGRGGGLAIWWITSFAIFVLSSSANFIDLSVSVPRTADVWYLSCVHDLVSSLSFGVCELLGKILGCV